MRIRRHARSHAPSPKILFTNSRTTATVCVNFLRTWIHLFLNHCRPVVKQKIDDVFVCVCVCFDVRIIWTVDRLMCHDMIRRRRSVAIKLSCMLYKILHSHQITFGCRPTCRKKEKGNPRKHASHAVQNTPIRRFARSDWWLWVTATMMICPSFLSQNTENAQISAWLTRKLSSYDFLF